MNNDQKILKQLYSEICKNEKLNPIPLQFKKVGKGGELCLIKNDKGDVEFVQARYEHTNGVYYFMAYSGIVELHNVVRWAYIKDLIMEE